jgi:protease I
MARPRELEGLRAAVPRGRRRRGIGADGAGARVTVVSPGGRELEAYRGHRPATRIGVDGDVADAKPEDFDTLMLPGGVINTDALRMDEDARRFVKGVHDGEKPVAAICHAPWILVSLGLVRGRTLTSWHSLQDDIRNAGGQWVDREVVVDDKWVTSRSPRDLPAFNREMIALFSRSTPDVIRVALGA